MADVSETFIDFMFEFHVVFIVLIVFRLSWLRIIMLKGS